MAAELEGPLGPNPFKPKDPRFRKWQENSRKAEEELAKFEAQHAAIQYVQSAANQFVPTWQLMTAKLEAKVNFDGGRFGILCNWWMKSLVEDHASAIKFAKMITEKAAARLREIESVNPPGTVPESLSLRFAHVVLENRAEALVLARELEAQKFTVSDSLDQCKAARRGLLEAFRARETKRLKREIRDKEIYSALGYADQSSLQSWLRCDPKARNASPTIAKKIELFLQESKLPE